MRIILYFAFAVALLFAPAANATQKTKAQLTTEINTMFPSSGQGLITAAILRQVTQDMVDSAQQINLLNAQTGTTYTFTAADQGYLVTFNNAAGVTVTLPAATGSFGTGWNAIAQNLDTTNNVVINVVAGTINGASSLTILPGQVALIVSGGLNVYRAILYGNVYTTRIISSGSGLSGGGDLSTDRTLFITDTITAGGPTGDTSTVPVITYNSHGQLTTVTTAAITPGSISAVPTTRIISSGTGLSGGGDLSADRTLSIASLITAAGPIGTSSAVPTITFNARGQLTTVITTGISPAAIGALALSDQNQSFLGGATTQANLAAAAAGSFTANCGRGPTQYITADTSAWAITAPASDGSCIIKITNPASAVTPSFTGFTVGSNIGASMTTANGAIFSVQIWRIAGTAAYQIFAHQ